MRTKDATHFKFFMGLDLKSGIAGLAGMDVIRLFFREFGLVYDPIRAFENFIHFDLHRTITNLFMSTAGVEKFRVGNVTVETPVDDEGKPLMPKDARLRNLSYVGSVMVDVEWYETGRVTRERLFYLPIMVGSSLCNNGDEESEGGFFIINGGEKVIIPQEKTANTGIIVVREGEKIIVDARSTNAYVRIEMDRHGRPVVSDKSNALDLVRGNGLLTDLEICTVVGGSSEIRALLMVECWRDRKEISVPFPDIRRAKLICCALYHGWMVYTGQADCTDRDHVGNKSVMTVGVLLDKLLRSSISRARTFYCKRLQKDKSFGQTCRTISKQFQYALSTGNWPSIGEFKMVGVSQVLARFNRLSTLSHLRRINIPLNKRGKNTEPRQIHGTQYGFICPAETPEGESCGLVKHTACTTILSTPVDPEIVLKQLTIIPGEAAFVVNGDYYGRTDPKNLIERVRMLRRSGKIPFDVSVFYDRLYKEIHIKTCGGRYVRPLILIGSITVPVERFLDYVNTGCIEFVSAEETDHEVRIGCTHNEIHQCVIYGLTASVIPFSNHNQAPRNVYYCAMAKQAVSSVSNKRLDTQNQMLHYPQRALVAPFMSNIIGEDEQPSGENAIVAICTMGGFNQEDSIVMSRSAIERGLFRSSYYRTCDEKEDVNVQTGKSDQIDVTNLPSPGERVCMSDKIIPLQVACSDGMTRSNDTTARMTGVGSVIQRTAIIGCKTNLKTVKVQYRTERVPQIGDKFCSSHGQKGICAMTLSHEDLPFTKDGIVPDIIINPHCIPSRMTIAHLIETLQGKVGCVQAKTKDGTPFDHDINSISNEMHACGFQKHGLEALYCGKTGKRIPCLIFIGPIHYRRLKHQVDDKIHARNRGPISRLTRQPVEGRSRDGGLRFGEMERDALLAHGASYMIRDRLYDSSDPYSVQVCTKCGLFVQCKCVLAIRQETRIPYATKLLFEELYAMGIAPRIL